MTEKITLGTKILTEMEKQRTDVSISELQETSQKNYMQNVMDKALEFTQKHPGDCYIVVNGRMHKVFANFGVPVVEERPVARFSCPTPWYDQTVFKFNYKDQALDYLWTVPSKASCDYYNAYPGEDDIELRRMVKAFQSHQLLHFSMKENGELENDQAQLILEPKEKND